MKTLFLFDQGGGRPVFLEADGDYSHLEGVYINDVGDPDLEQELKDLVYTENGSIKLKIHYQPTKDWDCFVLIGFAH